MHVQTLPDLRVSLTSTKSVGSMYGSSEILTGKVSEILTGFISGCVSPGLFCCVMVCAHARPNTTRSKSVLAPSLLAPCTGEVSGILTGEVSEILTGFISGCVSPGLFCCVMVCAHARPNTTRSKSELAPSLLAPCTEADAASPQAYRPCTILSLPFSYVITCKTANQHYIISSYMHRFRHILYSGCDN